MKIHFDGILKIIPESDAEKRALENEHIYDLSPLLLNLYYSGKLTDEREKWKDKPPVINGGTSVWARR